MTDHEEYSDFDFGFTAADEDELNSLMGADTDDVTSEETKSKNNTTNSWKQKCMK